MKLRRLSSTLFVSGALVASACGTELASDVIDTTVPDQVEVTQVDETSPDLFADDTTTTAPAQTAIPSAAPLPARLSLIDPGALQGESIVLGGQVPDGATWSGTMSQRFASSIDGEPSPAFPVFAIGMTANVEQLATDRWLFRGGYSSVELVDANGADAATVDSSLELMSGLTELTYFTEVDEFGLTSNSTFDGLDALDPFLSAFLEPMLDQVDDITVPAPSEPLGIGAMWSDTVSLELGGVTTTTKITYVLTEIDGDRYTLEVTQEQSQSGAGIISSNGTFTGTIEGDVTEPLPLRSVVSGDGTTVTQGADGQQVTIVFSMEALIEGS